MKNIVGQTPRGKDYFQRDYLIKRIYRRLEAGNNIFISAPRRVGKTSIMRHLQDKARKDYHFIYIITESIDNSEDYFRKLLEELLRSKVIKQITKISEQSKNLISNILDRLKSLSIAGLVEFELNGGQASSYQKEFEKLLNKLETKDLQIVIMVDEFPQTVENIRIKSGNEFALEFLRINREQRQQANAQIKFMLTGSIGLPVIVKKLGSLQLINDLNMVEIPPLNEEEATEMTQRLLRNYGVKYSQAVIPYLLKKLHWLIPFHIQLAAQEIIDIHEITGSTLGPQSIDQAFERIANHRNDIYFDSYYSRLSQGFHGKTLEFVLLLLKSLAQQNVIKRTKLKELAQTLEIEGELNQILDSLMYDGYINNHLNSQEYRFNSSILKLWWQKYRAN